MFHILQDMIENKKLDDNKFSNTIIQNNYNYHPHLIIIKNYNVYKKDEYNKIKQLLFSNNYRQYYKNSQQITFNYEKQLSNTELRDSVNLETEYVKKNPAYQDVKKHTLVEKEKIWINHINSLPNINNQLKHNLRLVRILFISYDINEPQKWMCGQRALDFIKYLEENFIDPYQQVKVHIMPISFKFDMQQINKLFDDQYPPDILISQQFAIEHGLHYANMLKIPHFILIHTNIGEYPNIKFEQAKPSSILAWNDNLTKQMKEITPYIPVINLHEGKLVNLPNTLLKTDLSYPEMKLNINYDIWDVICFKISVIIPCHGRHVLKMNNVLNNLTEQIYPVYEVIISFSLNPEQDLEELAKKVKEYRVNYKHKLNLKCILNPENMVTSVNRNIAASQATGDILLFLDADDLYHPQLTQIIQYVWKKYDPVDLHWFYIKTSSEKCMRIDSNNTELISNILSGKTSFNRDDVEIVKSDEKGDIKTDLYGIKRGDINDLVSRKYSEDDIKMWNFRDEYINYLEDLEFNPWKWINQVNISHGHHAMRRDVWEENPYTKMMPMGEDVFHFREILTKYIERSGYLILHLSLYQIEQSSSLSD